MKDEIIIKGKIPKKAKYDYVEKLKKHIMVESSSKENISKFTFLDYDGFYNDTIGFLAEAIYNFRTDLKNKNLREYELKISEKNININFKEV